MSVAAVGYPGMLCTSALRGMMNAVGAFKDMLDGEEEVNRSDLQVSFDELNDLMGMEALDAMETRYTV